MRIAQDVHGEARQGDVIRAQGAQDTEDTGEPLPVSFDITPGHARSTDLCHPGHEPDRAAMRRRPFHTKRLDTVEPSLPPPWNW
jgi:hypothetical protein